jgi:hypothetical protein
MTTDPITTRRGIMKNKCSNCQYFASQGARGYCEHPDDLTPTGGGGRQIQGSDSCHRFQWPGELGVSKSLWGEACIAMGREQAAIAIAIVSAKPAEHFRSTPGGYFHGMVAKAKTGELNLARTIWGLRQAIAQKPRLRLSR